MRDRRDGPLATWPARDLEWAHRAELELALRGAGAGGISLVLAEARAHLDDASVPAAEMFGDPRAYAAERLPDAMTEVERVDADLLAPSPSRWVAWWLAACGVQLALLAVADLLGIGFDGRLLVLGAVLAAGTGAVTGAWALLENGFPWSAGAAGTAGGGIIVAGAWALTSGHHGPAVPPLAILAVGLALASTGVALLRARRALPDAPRTREAWLDRLRGLLVGRHLFTPGEARAAVADVAGHAADPATEFGHPEVYADALARHAGRTAGRRTRLRSWAHLAGGILLLALGLSGLVGGVDAFSVALTAAGAALVVPAARALRRPPR